MRDVPGTLERGSMSETFHCCLRGLILARSQKHQNVDISGPRLAALRLSDGESERLALAAGCSAVAQLC